MKVKIELEIDSELIDEAEYGSYSNMQNIAEKFLDEIITKVREQENKK